MKIREVGNTLSQPIGIAAVFNPQTHKVEVFTVGTDQVVYQWDEIDEIWGVKRR